MAKGRDGYVMMAQDPFWESLFDKNPRPSVAIIPKGISIPKLAVPDHVGQSYRQEIGILDECTHIVGTIGRVVAERCPLTLIEIFSAIFRSMPASMNVHFFMGGDGSLIGAVRERGS